MTKWRMNLTRCDDAPSATYGRREALATQGIVTNSSLYEDPVISEQLRRHVEAVRGSLVTMAAKAGRKPRSTDVEYQINGAATGPIEFRVQMVFE